MVLSSQAQKTSIVSNGPNEWEEWLGVIITKANGAQIRYGVTDLIWKIIIIRYHIIDPGLMITNHPQSSEPTSLT